MVFGWLELIVLKQTEACTTFPSLTTVAHLTRGDTRSTETHVCGPDDGDTHTSIDIATDLGIRLIPLLRNHGGEMLKEGFSFLSRHPVSGKDEGGEVPT